MFDNKVFDDWLDAQAQKAMNQIGNSEAISPEQMTILVLKGQTNHFHHLDIELREDMKSMNERLSGEMRALREDMKSMNERLSGEMRALREDMKSMNERLSVEMRALREDMDKRFEQVDKRFEQVDKRFEQLTSRIDHFMIWSFATTVSVGAVIVTVIKFL
jgi:predicted nuclease with TOPRIM domain